MAVSLKWSRWTENVPWICVGAVSYTHLDVYKRQVIGGIAGAAPPLLGWAAVTGMQNPWDWAHALLLVLIIFVWTPPHFWACLLYTSRCV